MNDYRAPGGFNILPPIVKNLLIINGIVALAVFLIPDARYFIQGNLALYIPGSWELKFLPNGTFFPTQLITYMFVHDSTSAGHLIFNMIGLWMFGSWIENYMGAKRFLIYYLLTGVGAALAHIAYVYVIFSSEGIPISLLGTPGYQFSVVGASGAIYGILTAFGFLFPNNRVHLYFFIPVKAKYFVIGIIALDLFLGLSGSNDGVAHFAHLGGALVGFVYLWLKRKGR